MDIINNMKGIKRLILGIGVISALSSSVYAEKHLVLLDGYLGWKESMPDYLKANHDALENLPFSGRAVVGNVYTSYVMSADPNFNKVTYDRVWNEVGKLKNVFTKKKDNFLRINVDFPGDFWDDAIWERTTKNFANVAKAAKNIGFKGIMFDDEVYTSIQHLKGRYMENFKFPRPALVEANPGNYEQWEIMGSRDARGPTPWMDYKCWVNGKQLVDSENCSYRNPNHTFKEHMDKVASRFEAIMKAMEAEFPDITVLVLHGPATAHPKTNSDGHLIKPNSLYQGHEYKGAMFLGFKQGLNGQASLHDLGEFYRYKTDAEFQNAYQWRKFDIASEQYNIGLDDSFQWVIPTNQRASWSDKVDVGFMVSDYGLPPTRGGYNTQGLCTPADVETRLTKALKYTDSYVVFYPDSSLSDCDKDIRWADVSKPMDARWLNMVTRVYDSIHTALEVSSIRVGNIQENAARVFWDVSDYATGQVEYGETKAYGHFNKKETSFVYNSHGQWLRNLKAGTTYHYRVISEDAQGNKVTSGDHTFNTLHAPLEISSVRVGNIKKHVVRVFWDVSKYATGQVEYGRTSAYGHFSKKETSFVYNSHGQWLRNLKAGATYHYRVISEDAQGNKAISQDHTFTTKADALSVTGYVARGAVKQYKIHALAGQKVAARIDRLSADADLRIQIGSKAGIHSFECKSVRGGRRPDACSVTLTRDADVYVGVFGYRSARYRLKAIAK